MLPLFITIQAFFADTFERIERNEKGATAVEYGLLIGMISLLIVGALVAIGPEFVALVGRITAAI